MKEVCQASRLKLSGSGLSIPTCLLFACVMGTPVDTTEAAVRPNADDHAFYSAIYHAQTMSGEHLGFAVNPHPFPNNTACLRPSTAEEREMVEAAKRQVTGPVGWERRFRLAGEYTLVPSNEVDKAIGCIESSSRKNQAECQAYAKLRYVRFLSIPIFNKENTRALVVLSRTCGGLCGDGGVFVYRKTVRGWEFEKNSFAMCRWVS